MYAFGAIYAVGGLDHATLYKTVCKLLKRLGVDSSKVWGVATDGASSVSSRKNGVVGEIIRNMNPFALAVHCLAHQTALSAKVLGRSDDFNVVDKLITELYGYVCRSAKRKKALKFWQTELDIKAVNLLYLHKVRWLRRVRCVDNVLKALPAIILLLSEDEACPIAAALYLASLYSLKTLDMLAFARDILGSMARLTAYLQSTELVPHELEEAVNEALQTLEQNFGSAESIEE